MRHCAQCNGKLLLIKQKTETVEGSRSPITTMEYRCLDIECQTRMDKDTELRITSRDERQKKKDSKKKHKASKN
ncbi:MAG: hypothetical protein AAB521_03605 [Patescibacteria group bacterium]